MSKIVKYSEHIDVAILEFLWSMIGTKVEAFELVDKIIDYGILGNQEFKVTHHINALLVEGLIVLKPQENSKKFLIEITPSGLHTLRTYKVPRPILTKKSIQPFSWWR